MCQLSAIQDKVVGLPENKTWNDRGAKMLKEKCLSSEVKDMVGNIGYR
jgi:hypothetical protein